MHMGCFIAHFHQEAGQVFQNGSSRLGAGLIADRPRSAPLFGGVVDEMEHIDEAIGGVERGRLAGSHHPFADGATASLSLARWRMPTRTGASDATVDVVAGT